MSASPLKQTPAPESYLLRWRGDTLSVTLETDPSRKGRAAFRTNLGHAAVRRREVVEETERGIVPLARAWTDVPMLPVAPGRYRADIPLGQTGVFSGKACFFPEGSSVPEWPEGRNMHVKVESADTRSRNSIYCVFPRQFGSFREVARRLPHIMDAMGFRIVQTLPPFPVPATYAVMGEYGCPFAATDLFSVDPAMAEFDEAATPLDQFRELVGAVHARGGRIFIDLPANHTGWASTLQTHHPEWFKRDADGRFVSPGAWGVVWKDLVELDYSNAALREYMAGVFLFWCRLGVDGFRCDAGYMIAAETWEYIVAKVREEYDDTVFLLEGLGGEISATDRLLAESGLDWAYSEIFQTYDRRQFEEYFPGAAARSQRHGTLVHFAETHDNDRLAKGGRTYARLRVQLAALLSWQGAWGMANGVEWYCTEKIDVHGRNDLAWGAEDNMVALVSRLNAILSGHPGFSGAADVSLATRGGGNVLAVLRKSADAPGADVLVLANLDCNAPSEVDWDRQRFPAPEAFDLLTERKIDLRGAVTLPPGGVLCLALPYESAPRVDAAPVSGNAVFHLSFPRDAKRETVVPAAQTAEISADAPFRYRVTDPATGRTLRTGRSGMAGRRAEFEVPEYEGDGTLCRRLWLEVTRYEDGAARRTRSTLLVPPPAAAARMSLKIAGDEVRRSPLRRAILSDGAGAAAQVRAGWGLVDSQYDAFLAANPDPDCPSDRLSLWTRTRCWLQREGYLREFDARCQTAFFADPAGRFARWDFLVPCGMGLEASFRFTLSLKPGSNSAVLSVERLKEGARDPEGTVRIVFRPDVEWRSFHATTKAYADGTEGRFAAAATPAGAGGADGFDFRPYGDDSFSMRVSNATYRHEPQWTYCVPHGEEAGRGQDGSGDLFSPGWIAADLAVGDSMAIASSYARRGEKVPSVAASRRDAEDAAAVAAEAVDGLPMAEGLAQAMRLFIVKRDSLKTAIAGYPWFLDWGRDTFIFMRGMIAAGMEEDSMRILSAFAAFEERGTLPNIIHGKTAGNRDTTDAPLWFVRCVSELKVRGADVSALVTVCESIARSYFDGTPNGIRVDRTSGLVWSPSHFTWMDTNYPACTPREGYPVEIQALWISALRFLGRDADADRALHSVKTLFKAEKGYFDCLDAPRGEPAAQARPDPSVRPNQLMLLALGVLDDPGILDATEPLLVPGAIRSLSPGSCKYRGGYFGDEDTSRKPAYHNGTAWAWQFPMYAEALAASGRCGRDVALSLLAGAVENLNRGCVGQISEISDGDAPHAQRGCCAQAWSASELLRAWLALGGR